MRKILLFVVALGVLLSLTVFFGWLNTNDNAGEELENRHLAALRDFTDRRAHFDEIAEFFGEVAKERGGVYAFDLMRAGPLPFGLDQHLLGHVVGDILYEQTGIAGMGLCTHDFRNACSHTMVIGALIEHGDGALTDIRDACHAAPGGRGAYTMCFHGLGHGVLAYNGYDMEKGIAMCQEFGTTEFNQREATECFGGMIMEIIGGGGHDRDIWERKRAEYLNVGDPFALCRSDLVPPELRPMCYNYMTPHAFEAFGANMGYPDPVIYEKTFALCEKIPTTSTKEREACFGGLGKEFIGIVTGRNYTIGNQPSEAELNTMLDWCLLAATKDGQSACIRSTTNSLYWGAEQPVDVALTYCDLVADVDQQADCFNNLIWNVSYYVSDSDYRQQFCERLPHQHRSECVEKLL